LSIEPGALSFEPEVPIDGETVTITAIIKNIGGRKAGDVEVVIGDQLSVIGGIETGGSASVSWAGTFSAGTHKIIVEVDRNDLIEERDETNNIAEKNLTVATLPDLLNHENPKGRN
jgi:subtilase family serine protease